MDLVYASTLVGGYVVVAAVIHMYVREWLGSLVAVGWTPRDASGGIVAALAVYLPCTCRVLTAWY